MLYLLLLIVVANYYLNLGLSQVWMPNESFYAEASKNMIETGDFLTPYYNGNVRLEKPPLTYWIVSLGYYLFGINEWGLRFFHATLGLLFGIITFLLSYEQSKNYKVSLLSALILLTSFQFFANARYASPEIPFTFFITLSIYLWLKAYRKNSLILLLLAFISSSLAVLTKGPAGFVIPAGVVFSYLLISDPKELLKKRYYLLTLLLIPPSFWWHIFEFFSHKKEFLEVFYVENLRRLYDGNDPFYFYLLDTAISFMPYSFLVFFALLWTFIKKKKELTIFVVWFLLVFLVFSFIKSKIPVYVLPAYPAMAILTANFVLSSDWKSIIKYSSTFIALLISSAILLTTFYFQLEPAYTVLALLPLPFLLRNYAIAPLVAGTAFLIFVNTGVLNYIEGFRHYKEVGNFIKNLDPGNTLKTYQVGYFHHNLPFYADRTIIRDKHPEKPSIVIFKMGSFEGCKPTKVWKLYTSSESRFITFLLDTKRGKRLEEFGVCLYN